MSQETSKGGASCGVIGLWSRSIFLPNLRDDPTGYQEMRRMRWGAASQGAVFRVSPGSAPGERASTGGLARIAARSPHNRLFGRDRAPAGKKPHVCKGPNIAIVPPGSASDGV